MQKTKNQTAQLPSLEQAVSRCGCCPVVAVRLLCSPDRDIECNAAYFYQSPFSFSICLFIFKEQCLSL